MKTINDYLDDAAEITNSDYKTAKLIGCSRQLVSSARKTGILGEKSCVKLAEVIGVNPAEVMRASDVAKYPEHKKIWEKWVAAAVIMASILIGGTTVSSKSYASNLIENNYTLCAIVLFGVVAIMAIRSSKKRTM